MTDRSVPPGGQPSGTEDENDDQDVSQPKSPTMTKADRDALIKVARARGRQAEQRADARAKVLLAEAMNDITAEYKARDALWADAVAIAEDYVRRPTTRSVPGAPSWASRPTTRRVCKLGFHSRSAQLADRDRRAELASWPRPGWPR